MHLLRHMGSGIIYGLISSAIVVGGLSLAIAESYTSPAPTATSSAAAAASLTPTLPGPSPTPTASALPTSTPVPPSSCLPPGGWTLIIVGPNDTLQSLASQYHTSTSQLAAGNCLLTASLQAGYGIYVPPAPVNNLPCGVPAGWTHSYTVQPGDSFYSIAMLYGTTYQELQRANCNYSSYIAVGQLLWVPNSATTTPNSTVILIEGTPSQVPTDLLPTLAVPASATAPPATDTSAPTATATPTSVPPSPTITAFPSPTHYP
jgi:LysM repeat protein